MTSETPSIAAIVLGVDRLAKTRACVASLLGAEGWKPRIQVLDNGSSDGTGVAMASEFPGVRVERSDSNLGAATGRNLAVARAVDEWAPEFLLFVDDDAELHPAAIAALVAPFSEAGNERLGATAAKIRYPGDPPRIYVAGGSSIRFWMGDTSPYGQGELDRGQYDSPEPCIPGTGCLMVRRAAFDEVGGFDAAYDPYGYEDLDFSLRLIEAGWECLYVPMALAWHERGNVLGDGYYTARYAAVKRRNWKRFLRRHGSPLERMAFWLIGAPFLFTRLVVRELRAGNAAAIGGLLGLGGRRS